jgi:hypothetical protein
MLLGKPNSRAAGESEVEAVTPFGLGLLRQTAALVHTVPGLVVTVVHDGRPLVDVSWQGTRTHPAIRWLPPCGFRAVVAQALSTQRTGRDVALFGLPPGGEPTVRTRALAPATAHAFGLVSAIVGGRAVWAHATLAPPDTVATVVEQVSTAGPLPAAGPLCVDLLLHDDDLDVTLVVVERSWRGCDAAPVRALAEALLVATCTAGLDEELARLVPAG